MDPFDKFVANLFKARPLIEELAMAIKEYNSYTPDFSYTFEYPFPNGESNKLRFDREHMERYMRFSREIPDKVVAQNLREFNGNVEYTLQNIFIILLKYYRELAYLYKAKDLAQQKIAVNVNIEYLFKNPFHEFMTSFATDTKKYLGTTLIYLDSIEGEFEDIFSSFAEDDRDDEEMTDNNAEGNDDAAAKTDEIVERNIQMIITKETNLNV